MKGLFFRATLLSIFFLQQSHVAYSQSAGSPEVGYDCAGIPNGTTQVTDCGCGKPASSTFLCGACGDNTSCLDCAGTPFGEKVTSGPIGGVPSGDPCTLVCPQGTTLYAPENRCLTQEDACKRVDANLISVGVVTYHPTKKPSVNTTSAVIKRGVGAFTTFAGVNTHSSCIGNALERCLPGGHAIDYMLIARRQSSNNDADKCAASIVRSWGVTQRYNGSFSLFGAPTDVLAGYAYVTRSVEQGCGPASPELVTLAQDAGCDVMGIDVVEFHSPVSLLWSDDVAIDNVTSFAGFPLDGKSAGDAKLFQWRASGMTPLVVYDSTGLGEIKDATQLFGNYTFGKEWKNGYDALASLDIDKSGWLEGEELNAVSLWFDFDQDGISQKGEVKRLADVGVHSIGVNGDSTDEKTRNIFASQGFKRTVDGKEHVGRSVDWFGGIAQGTLPKRQVSVEKGAGTATQSEQVAAPDAEAVKVDLRSTVSGVWEWRMTDDKMLLPEQQPGGFLAFTQEGSSIRGQSVSTKEFLPNMYKIDELVTAIPVSGRFGKDGVSFDVQGSKKSLASSNAKLSPDGMTLSGTTTQEVSVEGGSAKVTFAWEAKRLIRAE